MTEVRAVEAESVAVAQSVLKAIEPAAGRSLAHRGD
jgi:hypothetical protein